MRNPFRRDLVLLHPPAVYDFRTKPAFLGPLADAVPSTAMFEMYPVGLTSIAAFLERNHYNVEIVNLAYRMLQDPRFDVVQQLQRMSAPVFGIDLHWLPHVQGALSVIELVKRLHPESRTLVGGLSASYYHDELVRYPFVDFVLRGDSTEEPARQLLQALRESRPLETVENLTWKRADGTVVVNPLTFVPKDLDYVDVPAYRYLLRSVFKYHSLRNLVPHLEWLHYPVTLLLSARGCTENCSVCGGSKSAYRLICERERPAFRSPEKLAEDVAVIGSFSRAPIFMVHDPRMGGMRRACRLFSLLEALQPPNEMVFELYYPAGDDFFEMVARSIPTWSIEITLESPDEALRKRNGKFPWSNAIVEATIERALAHGCRKLDVFFMTGLPGQRYEDALAIADYAEHLLDRFGFDGRAAPVRRPARTVSRSGMPRVRAGRLRLPAVLSHARGSSPGLPSQRLAPDPVVRDERHDPRRDRPGHLRCGGAVERAEVPPRADRSPHVHRRAVPPGRRSTDRGEPRRRHPDRAGRRPGQPPDDVWRRRVEVARQAAVPHRRDAAAGFGRRPRAGIRPHGREADRTVRRVAGGALTRDVRVRAAGARECEPPPGPSDRPAPAGCR